MLDHWFSVIKLPLSWRQFHRLPENPAYKYEYFRQDRLAVALVRSSIMRGWIFTVGKGSSPVKLTPRNP